MGERIQKVKNHIRAYRVTYISCGITAVGVAGFTCLIMRGRHAENSMGSDRLDGESVRSLLFFSNGNNLVTSIEREGRGHPGYIVRCLETNQIFGSQNKAANAMRISEKLISKHINGEFDHANGYHFERIQAA